MDQRPRYRTHVHGLDENIGGGIPEGSVVLLSGTAGTMKSSLAYYMLYTNARMTRSPASTSHWSSPGTACCGRCTGWDSRAS